MIRLPSTWRNMVAPLLSSGLQPAFAHFTHAETARASRQVAGNSYAGGWMAGRDARPTGKANAAVAPTKPPLRIIAPMFGLELWVVLARLSAVACALLSGYLLGRTAPDWLGDDETLRTHGGGMLGYYYRPQVLYGRGCFSGSFSAGLLGVAALLLLGFGWPEVLEGIGIYRRGSFMTLLFTGPFWLVVAAWFVGWGIGRFTDKGPVGPLE